MTAMVLICFCKSFARAKLSFALYFCSKDCFFYGLPRHFAKTARKDKMRKILCKFDFKGEIELNLTKNLTKKQKSAKNSSFFAKKC